MADEFKIEGVRLEELEPVSVLDDEAIFLVSSNKVCRIISLSSLRRAFAGNPSSPNKDEVYYNATYIDNKFKVVEGNVTEIQNRVNNFTNEINQQVQNINNKFDEFKTDVNNKVQQSINNALQQVDQKISQAINQVNQKITELTQNVNSVSSKVDDLDREFKQFSTNIDGVIEQKINASISKVDQKIQAKIEEAMSGIDQKIQDKIDQISSTINSTIDQKINTAKTEINSSVDNKLNGYVQKSNKSSITVQASGWTGDDRNPPFRNVLTITGVTTTNNVEILLPGTASLEQVEAWCAAGVVHGTQTTNSVTLLGYGDKPEIDIPLEVIIRKDI